ncbi:MAG: ABC transporter permease [Sphaerochaetaceae bacterium]|jgi:putative ABC transport system permease protein
MVSLALKNCIRNVRRSLLTAIAVFIAIWVVVVMMGVMQTVVADMIRNNKEYESGDIRLRIADYSKYENIMPLQFFIPSVDDVCRSVLSVDGVRSCEPLSRLSVSAYRGEQLKTIQAVGVDTSISHFTTGRDVEILAGRMIDNGKREIVMTPKLLSELGMEVGDSLTILSKTSTSGSNGASFRIVGIVSYGNSEYNGDVVVMPLDQLSSLTRMDGGAMEVLVHIDPSAGLDATIASIKLALADPSLEVRSWDEISLIAPFLSMYDITYLIIELLFFFIASTLIFNTTMMSVMERKREVSTMIALGFSRSSIIRLFMTEGMIISTLGAVAAAVVGKATVALMGRYGIDLTLFGTEAVDGWGFSRMLYPQVSWSTVLSVSMICLAVAFGATTLASMRVRRIEAAQALREEN